MHRLIYAFFFLFSFHSVSAQIALSPQAKVSVLTCDVGQEVYSLFGHTAIRINDPSTQIDLVFNYGAFDFNTPHFILQFSRGDLQYFVTAESFDQFLMQYYAEKRSVWEQELLLTYEQKKTLFSSLVSVMQTQERFYTYKFIDQNCTNMALNKINSSIGQIAIKKLDSSQTYRDIIFPFFSNHFYEQWGTSILFGTKVDAAASQIFLPIEFMQSLAVAKLNGKPLAGPTKKILQVSSTQKRLSWWNNLYTYLLVVGLLFVGYKQPLIRAGLFSFMAFLGIVFIWAMCFSQHKELANNYNILLFNPLLVLLLWFERRQKIKSASVLAVACLGFLAIYLLILSTKAHFLLLLPLVAITALSLFGIIKKGK